MGKNVLEKFQESLSPEVFAELEESIQNLIEEKARTRAEFLIEEEKIRLEELAEDFCKQEIEARYEVKEKELKESYEAKTEEFKATAIEKLQELSEKYVEEQLTEAKKTIVEDLETKYTEKFEKLEESVLDNLDKFLDMEITSKISDDLLKEVAINEAYKPLISGIFNLFENNLVSLTSDGSKQIKEAEEKATKLQSELNESYQKSLKDHEKIDALKTGLLIASKVDGLTSKQKSRVISMFEGKSYDEVSSKIDTFVEILEENDNSHFESNSGKSSKVKKEMINEDIFSIESDLELNENDDVKKEDDDVDIKLADINNLLRDR